LSATLSHSRLDWRVQQPNDVAVGLVEGDPRMREAARDCVLQAIYQYGEHRVSPTRSTIMEMIQGQARRQESTRAEEEP